jgi:predicted aspartyl protease
MIPLLFAALLAPSELLAKAHAATGALEPGTYRIVSRVALSGGSLSDTRVVQGSNYVETESDGVITTAEGSFNGVDWAQNGNGIVLTRDKASLYEDPYQAALDAPDVASAVLDVENDSDGNIVLDITRPSGSSKRYTYDSTTFLPVRVDYNDAGERRSYIFSDYKRYFGIMFPAHITYTSQLAKNDATYDLVSYDRVSAADVSLAIPTSKPVFDLGSRTSLPIPADFSSDGVIVRVTVAGRGLDFLLDSGSSESIIDVDVARELGLSVHDQRTLAYSGTPMAGETVINDLSLGDIHAPHFAIETVPFSLNVDQKKVVGILGGDFFASGRIAVDFGARTVTMLAPAMQLPATGWTKLPIQVTAFVPVTTAAFNGFKGTFVVDTGAWSTVLYRHYFAHFMPKAMAVEGQASGISGKRFDFRTYHMSRIDIGDLAFVNIQVEVLDSGKTDNYSVDGLLGRTFLNNFSLIFDYADQTLYLKPEI